MLDKIRPARKFDGYDLIIDSTEFDGLMAAFEKVKKVHERDESSYMPFINSINKAKNAICQYGYFEPEEKAVHIRLGSNEFVTVMECLMLYSAYMSVNTETYKNQEVTFEKMIAKDTTKFWKNS